MSIMKLLKVNLLAALLVLFVSVAYAQKPMDEANEKNVHITQGPSITNNSGSNATLTWTTDHQGANHVQYRRAGSNESWKSAYHSGGGTQHSVQLSGLQSGQTYEYQILTRDGDVRTSGQFQAGNGNTGTVASNPSTSMPTSTGVNNSGMPSSGGGDKVTLYREVGPNGTHTFNTSATPTPGFNNEGVAGYVLNAQRGGTVPMYRMTNGSGDTLFTTDQNEHQRAMSQGYQDQGVVGYIATSNWRGTTPLYRMVNGSGQHFYTTSASEHQSAQGQGYHDEATIGYIWTQQ
jgi:hypothetical protein